METQTLISIREFCASYDVEHTYILQLQEFGLITLEKNEYIPQNNLPKVEQILRFNRELDINLEGIEVIFNLLDRVREMDREMVRLRNRLKIYEELK